MNWTTALKILLVVFVISFSFYFIKTLVDCVVEIGNCIKINNLDEDYTMKIYDIKNNIVTCEICSPRKCMFKELTMEELEKNYHKVPCEE
jgi:hypothetical protein